MPVSGWQLHACTHMQLACRLPSGGSQVHTSSSTLRPQGLGIAGLCSGLRLRELGQKARAASRDGPALARTGQARGLWRSRVSHWSAPLPLCTCVCLQVRARHVCAHVRPHSCSRWAGLPPGRDTLVQTRGEPSVFRLTGLLAAARLAVQPSVGMALSVPLATSNRKANSNWLVQNQFVYRGYLWTSTVGPAVYAVVCQCVVSGVL